MKILAVGDIVGNSGLKKLETEYKKIKEKEEIDFTIVNGENVSSDDTVHVATALQRGDALTFLTTDHILKNMSVKGITFLDS